MRPTSATQCAPSMSIVSCPAECTGSSGGSHFQPDPSVVNWLEQAQGKGSQRRVLLVGLGCSYAFMWQTAPLPLGSPVHPLTPFASCSAMCWQSVGMRSGDIGGCGSLPVDSMQPAVHRQPDAQGVTYAWVAAGSPPGGHLCARDTQIAHDPHMVLCLLGQCMAQSTATLLQASPSSELYRPDFGMSSVPSLLSAQCSATLLSCCQQFTQPWHWKCRSTPDATSQSVIEECTAKTMLRKMSCRSLHRC